MSVVDQFKLFPAERQTLSATDFINMVRSRIEIKPVPLEAQSLIRTNNPSIAFTVSFDCEEPNLAAKVANQLLTRILSDDAARRTSRASETTRFLEQEVRRLQGEHDAIVAQIEAIKHQPLDEQDAASDDMKERAKSLADLERELAQKSSIYSDEHPAIKNLKKQIAALKQIISAAPKETSAAKEGSQGWRCCRDSQGTALDRREEFLGDATVKLNAARLGENLEKSQQSEHLRVIEDPTVPSTPVRPKKLKWLAIAFGVAGVIGAGAIFAREMLDGSIRGGRDLTKIVDRHLIITIPYLSAPGEGRRRRWKFIVFWIFLVSVLGAGIIGAAMKRGSVDFAGIDRHTITSLWK